MDGGDLQGHKKLFEKELSVTDIKNPLVVPMDALGFFQIPEGEREMSTPATDKERQEWSFRLFIRRHGHPKPTLGGEGWPSFARAKGLKAGDKIEMYRMQQSDGDEVTYKIRAYTKIFNAWFPIA